MQRNALADKLVLSPNANNFSFFVFAVYTHSNSFFSRLNITMCDSGMSDNLTPLEFVQEWRRKVCTYFHYDTRLVSEVASVQFAVCLVRQSVERRTGIGSNESIRSHDRRPQAELQL